MIKKFWFDEKGYFKNRWRYRNFKREKTANDINENNKSENESLDEIIVNESKEQNYIEDFIESTFDFSIDNIIKNLKNNLNINCELSTNLFIIIDSTGDYYLLKCFENNEIYSLMKNDSYLGNLNFSKNDILIINDYYSDKKNINIIEPTKITIFESIYFLYFKNIKLMQNIYGEK